MSTASLRANMPPNGVLAEAVAHSQPAAIFGSGVTRVELLRVDNGAPTSKPPSPAAPAYRSATRRPPRRCNRAGCARGPAVSDGGSTRACDAGSDRWRRNPFGSRTFRAIEGEDDTGTPRRDITVRGPRDRLQAVAAFFERQVGPFAVQSVDLTAKGLRVRFPVRTKDIGLGARSGAAQAASGCAAGGRPAPQPTGRAGSTWYASTAPRKARSRRATTRIRRAIGRCPRGRTWW